MGAGRERLPAQGQVGRVEEAALGQEGIQRSGVRVVTPKVVTPGLAIDAGADPAQELAAHWAELNAREWSISPITSGQFATALSRCMAPPGATPPAARRAR